MKKRFIVLIDFSTYSEWLLAFTYKWAQQVNSELLLVHHTTDLIPGLGDSEVLSELKYSSVERSINKLKSLAETVVGNNPFIKYHSNSYNVSSAVMKLQESNTTDYVFVGMNDKTGIEKLLISSTALQLADNIERVIIALPTATSDFHYDQLYIGIKNPHSLDTTHFEELLAITSDKYHHITFFSVVKDKAPLNEITEYLQLLCNKYAKLASLSYKIFESENTTQTIKDYMHENKGVLVIQKGPRNFIDIFRPYFTTEIVHHAQIPVIILP